ncbi:hypothetical protein AB0J83_22690 [Actinoplanes sp. NPDC049596]|uniref:diaminopimelate decarboxylase family protein n=1 Tax=unclassified Actinoplanes TaxID=2626549 RepID=UPI003449EEA8
MTLADLLPSLRIALRPPLDPAVWPLTTRWTGGGDLQIGGVRVSKLAGSYGTPLHVLDEHDVRERSVGYLTAFGERSVTYSARAGLTLETATWIASSGLGCRVSSAAELRIALTAGFRPADIVLGGAGKSLADLDAANACGAAVVAGSVAEVEQIAARAVLPQRVWLRTVPALAGRRRTRYGVKCGTGPALAAVAAIRSAPMLDLAGLDCDCGHQLSRFQPFESSVREVLGFATVVRSRYGITVPAVNLGGGHAATYRCGDDGFAVDAFAVRARAMVRLSAEYFGIHEPRLTVSPGRSIMSRAGVTLTRVAAVSSNVGGLTVSLDEGVPGCGPAPCSGRHSIMLVGRESRAALRAATVVETFGRTQTAAELPADIEAGDLIAIAGTGGYHYAHSPSVGGAAVLGVAGGTVRTIKRRPTLEELAS